MPATWNWLLADAAGTALAELTGAAGRALTFKRNVFTEVRGALSHEDPAATILLNALATTGIPTLRCYRNGGLRFNGYLAPFQEDAAEQSILSFVFRSPFARLIGDNQGTGRFVDFLFPGTTYTAQDAGSIAQSLLIITNSTSGATGLIAGTLQASKNRDRAYGNSNINIGQAITDLTNVLDGFDFEEQYLESGSTLAQLNIYANQGTSRPNARFEYGPETLANIASLQRTTSPPINQTTVVGANNLRAFGTDAGSQATYGVWPALYTASDVSEATTLQDKANALLRPLPVKTLSFTPDALLAPKPWDDFGIGDTVPVYIKRGALVQDVSVRVNGFTVVIDENGNEATEIPDPLTPDEEATLRANLQVEVTT